MFDIIVSGCAGNVKNVLHCRIAATRAVSAWIGTSMGTFLPVMAITDDDITVKLIYDGKYEFSLTNFLGLSGQLYMESLNPLASKTGTIIFQVAEEVETSGKPLQLVFDYDNKDYAFDLRS